MVQIRAETEELLRRFDEAILEAESVNSSPFSQPRRNIPAPSLDTDELMRKFDAAIAETLMDLPRFDPIVPRSIGHSRDRKKTETPERLSRRTRDLKDLRIDSPSLPGSESFRRSRVVPVDSPEPAADGDPAHASSALSKISTAERNTEPSASSEVDGGADGEVRDHDVAQDVEISVNGTADSGPIYAAHQEEPLAEVSVRRVFVWDVLALMEVICWLRRS